MRRLLIIALLLVAACSSQHDPPGPVSTIIDGNPCEWSYDYGEYLCEIDASDTDI